MPSKTTDSVQVVHYTVEKYDTMVMFSGTV